MNSNEKDYMEIDLMRLFKALWQRAWVIAVATISAALIAFAYVSLLVTPLYKASALMYVNNSSFNLQSVGFSFSSAQISAAKSLVDTYTVILNTRTTLTSVIDKAGLDYKYEDLRRMIDTSSVNDTEIFRITVTSPDPKEAEVIANTIAAVLPDKIADIVDGSSVKLVDYAVVPSVKSSPNITKYTMIGAFLGFVVSCGIIVILELMDDLVHSDDYLIQTYKLPVLAAIPDLDDSSSSNYGSYSKYGGYYAKSSKSGGQS